MEYKQKRSIYIIGRKEKETQHYKSEFLKLGHDVQTNFDTVINYEFLEYDTCVVLEPVTYEKYLLAGYLCGKGIEVILYNDSAVTMSIVDNLPILKYGRLKELKGHIGKVEPPASEDGLLAVFIKWLKTKNVFTDPVLNYEAFGMYLLFTMGTPITSYIVYWMMDINGSTFLAICSTISVVVWMTWQYLRPWSWRSHFIIAVLYLLFWGFVMWRIFRLNFLTLEPDLSILCNDRYTTHYPVWITVGFFLVWVICHILIWAKIYDIMPDSPSASSAIRNTPSNPVRWNARGDRSSSSSYHSQMAPWESAARQDDMYHGWECGHEH